MIEIQCTILEHQSPLFGDPIRGQHVLGTGISEQHIAHNYTHTPCHCTDDDSGKADAVEDFGALHNTNELRWVAASGYTTRERRRQTRRITLTRRMVQCGTFLLAKIRADDPMPSIRAFCSSILALFASCLALSSASPFAWLGRACENACIPPSVALT